MRLLITGNNDGPLRAAASLRRAGVDVPLGVALQKEVPPVLAKAYADEAYLPRVLYAPKEAATLRICEQLEPTHVLNVFANYRFRELLDVAPCLNVHLAPLPRYRGRHPLPWALIKGEKTYGVTCHEMNENWDDGAILWQALVEVAPLSSVAQLREQLMRAVDEQFGTFWAAFAKTGGTPVDNELNEGDYVPRRTPTDSELTEWKDPALIVRKVMALRSESNPAFLWVGKEKLVTRFAQLRTTVKPSGTNDQPVISRVGTDRVIVETSGGAVIELSQLSD